MTPHTSITLGIGPRLSEDFVTVGTPSTSTELTLQSAVGANATASINHSKEKTRLSLRYGRSQNQVFSQSGFVNTDSLVFIFRRDAGRSFNFRLSPGAFRNTRAGAETWTYRASVNANLALAKWLSLTSTYRFTFQRGRFVSTDTGVVVDGREFTRNVVTVGLTLGKSFPLD